MLAAVLTVVAACGGAPPAATGVAPSAPAAVAPAHGVVVVEVTFYGALDNDPPGSTEIAYPNGRHPAAGVRTVRDADDDSALRCIHGTSLR